MVAAGAESRHECPLSGVKRTFVPPEEVEYLSLTTLCEKLIKVGAKVVREGSQIGLPIAIYVGDSNTSTLIVGTEPAGYRLDVAPTTNHVTIAA